MARNPLLLLFLLLLQRPHLYAVESAIGVNWGMLSSHRIPPSIVVDLMRQNRIGKAKLFDSDPGILRALVGSGIEVMVGIPNEMLSALASSQAASDVWVSQNVSRYLVKRGVDIRRRSRPRTRSSPATTPMSGTPRWRRSPACPSAWSILSPFPDTAATALRTTSRRFFGFGSGHPFLIMATNSL